MTGKINELLNKIQSSREGMDYTISHGSQGTNYIIKSKELARSLRLILTPETYLSIEGEIIKTEGSYDSGDYYAYQGNASLISDKLVVGNAFESNPNLLKDNSLNFPQIREITDTETCKFEAESVKTVSGGSFSPFSSTSRTNDYCQNYRNENRETGQRNFETRQRELKEQEEKLAAERKKLEEEMKNETQQSQQQNFQNRESQ